MFSNALDRCFYNKTRAFLTFLALQHPAQELKSSLHGNSRTFRRSATSGPRTDVHFFIFRGSFRTFRCSCSHRVLTYRVPKHRAHTCCSHIEVFLWLCGGVFVVVFFVVVFLWWCSCSGVVVFLWWCFSPNSVVTLGVLTVIVKSRVSRSR